MELHTIGKTYLKIQYEHFQADGCVILSLVLTDFWRQIRKDLTVCSYLVRPAEVRSNLSLLRCNNLTNGIALYNVN